MPALDFPNTPSNGDTFGQYIYDGVRGVWRLNPEAPNANLDNLNDVTITSPTDGQALVFDSVSSNWINETPASNLSDLSDVSATSPNNGDVLSYDSGSGTWTSASAGITTGVFSIGTDTTIIGIFDSAQVSITAPSSPVEGDLWFDSSTSDLFIYYDSSWVGIN